MTRLYWPCLAAIVLFIAWAHTHTDEIPIVLGFVLILSAVLGLLYPKQFLITWLVIGLVMFLTETLVNYRVLHAPYPPGTGLAWPALLGLIPALIGSGVGAGIRRMAARAASV